MSNIDLSRFHQTFFEESREGLDAMESALLRLDVGQADAETINLIFRAAHSIKGGAGTFGFTAVAGFTHLLETLLERVRSGQRQVSQADVDLLLRSVDVTRAMLRAADGGDAVDLDAVARVSAELEQALELRSTVAAVAPAAVAAAAPGWSIRFLPKSEIFASGNDPLRILRELDRLGEACIACDSVALPPLAQALPERCYLSWTVELRGGCDEAAIREVFAWVEDECELHIQALAVPQDEVAPASSAKAEKPVLRVVEGGREPMQERRSGESGSIRVGTDKIDALINLVGELVITQAMLQQTATSLDPVLNEKLLQGLSLLDRNTRMLQEAVMSTRMLPVDAVFSRFPRMVRDLAAKLGKQIRLETVGEGTELDKGVIERIADPLTHLVRNSLDHGLEGTGQRIAAGKDPTGTITLRAAHQGGHIVIEVRDDGRGLDRERILSKALERGLAVPPNPSDADVWQLIFAPGFSTAEQVTDVSGRGVGMDVVKKNVQALSGQIEISTTPGRGTCVTIRLPLTLAILDGMSVRVGDDVFIVPLNCVVESLQPQPGQVKTLTGDARVVKVRNEYLPLAALYELFSIRADAIEPERGILVLLESEGRKVAIQVDELVGQQQVVIKSLEANYRRVHGVSGATILGDGRVALILDVAELVRGYARAAAA
ncbi:chemotaxis protein CheA [Solimonas sp. K1W22B-7]|uniref:chemotaxis protein CheA n=1 Tax=Solimonas sp. K1W22B-7 TaxID=2303331 RepID=UPI000E335CC6|nr:chemotaxis protein CheA [Solimonas sp. K1W22B-7]AXQ28213.1 chemotaxis protein CheA [Solimonas sp. K1W22B-7]